MVVKLILYVVLILATAYFLFNLPLTQFTPELKQERLKPEVIPTSPLEYPNLRWNHMPLSVYIDSRTAGKPSYPLDVKLALDMWKDATNSLISFTLTDEKDADITITWVEKLRSESLDAAGNADIKFYNQTNFKIITDANIQLLNSLEEKELTDFDMANLAMHEVGHALGLSHNDVEDSIMNPTLKIPSKEIKSIKLSEIQDLLGAYKIQPKPDLYLLPNSSVTKIVDKRLFKENYYINTLVTIENIGLVNATNTTIQIRADGIIVREDEIQELPVGSVLSRTYINLPVEKNFSSVEIVLDSENFIDELDERNNILVLKV